MKKPATDQKRDITPERKIKMPKTQRNPNKVFVGAHLPADLVLALDKHGLAASCRNRSHTLEILLSDALRELGLFLPEGVKHQKGAAK